MKDIFPNNQVMEETVVVKEESIFLGVVLADKVVILEDMVDMVNSVVYTVAYSYIHEKEFDHKIHVCKNVHDLRNHFRESFFRKKCQYTGEMYCVLPLRVSALVKSFQHIFLMM